MFPIGTAVRRRPLILLLGLALIASACGSDGGSTAGDGSLDGVRPHADTLEELDQLCFEGIDATGDLENLEVLMRADGLDDPISLWLYEDQGVLHTTAPLHPVTPGEGGSISLQLVDGDDAGPVLDLTLTPLPAAPGAWEEMIGTMRAELDARAAEFGSSLLELAATPFEDVDDQLLLTKIIQSYVDDGTPNDLESVLDDTAAEERALVEAVIAKIRPETLIAETVDLPPVGRADGCVAGLARDGASARGGGATPRPREVGWDLGGPRPNASSSLSSISPPLAAGGSGACRQFQLTIDNGAQLAAAVEKGVDARVKEGGAEEQALADINAVIAEGSNIPGYGGLIAAIGVVFSTISLWFQMDAAVYPTSFTSLTAETTATSFNEDFAERGRITGATVVAHATGFNATEAFSEVAKPLIDLLLDKAKGKIAESSSRSKMNEALRAEGDLAPEAEEALEPGVVEQLGLGGKLKDAIINELLDQFGDQYLEYCPQDWSVNIADFDYIDVQAIVGTFTEDKGTLEYWPEAQIVGARNEDTIRVRAKAEAFSGLTAQDDVAVEVDKIVVTASPAVIEVETPGETVDITAEISNADTTSLFWNAPFGEWTDGIGADTNDGRTRPYTTPTESSAYGDNGFLIEIRSTSEGGLREGLSESDPRNATVQVKLKPFIVTPDPGTVPVDQPLRFMATDRDGNPVEVRWSASAGSITSSGVYMHDTPGVYTVTARRAGNPDQSVTVQVTVTEASCIVGTWRVREQEFLDQIQSFAGGTATLTHLGGEFLLIFSGGPLMGGVTQQRNAWSLSMMTEQGTLIATMSGSETGNWSTNEEMTRLSIDGLGGEVNVILELEGFGVLPGGNQDVETGTVSGSGDLTCTSSTMVVTVGQFTWTLDRQS